MAGLAALLALALHALAPLSGICANVHAAQMHQREQAPLGHLCTSVCVRLRLPCVSSAASHAESMRCFRCSSASPVRRKCVKSARKTPRSRPRGRFAFGRE
eukprot:6194739-Pleurochrysis_carterae.AAC.3